MSVFMLCSLVLCMLRAHASNDTEQQDALSTLNITKVWDTNNRSWLYQQTSSNKIKGYVKLYAKFVYTDTYDRRRKPPKEMTVGPKPGTTMKTYLLRYGGGPDGCSVFTVWLNDNVLQPNAPYCEMYLREPNLRKGPSGGCKRCFERWCPGTPIPLYSKDCDMDPSVTENPQYMDYYNDYGPMIKN